MRTEAERGSISIWVLACCALLMVVGSVVTLRTAAVVARHRAEAAADLAALAAAGQIGISSAGCAAAARIAIANGSRMRSCRLALAPDERSGTVEVVIQARIDLPVVGSRAVAASARAGRLAPP